MDIPTLLIGIGGVGSRIVDRVYSLTSAEARRLLAVHAFDTNVNDIGKLVNLQGRDKVTQTSTNWTVGEYLNYYPEAKEWFPHEYPELRAKTLTEGAGQVRAVSRMALMSAIRDGKMANLEQEITRLLAVSGSAHLSSLRIMIVGTLAGGTGAGIFIQIALYLRDLLRQRFSTQSIIIKGAFLLPDTLINTGALQDNRQHPHVRANAYASMKELNAILKNRTSGTKSSGANNAIPQMAIELEYKPNQTDQQGLIDLALPADLIPYDFIYLYDFENENGRNLGNSFANYEEQVVRAIQLQLFSAMSASVYSAEDNDIIELINQNSRNRFCGTGVAMLIYPYQEIVDYCALRWAVDVLSDQWLKLDNVYNDELKAWQRDMKNGISERDKPKLTDRYPKLLEQEGTGEKPKRFFRDVFRSLHLPGKRSNEVGTAKYAEFIAAVNTEIERNADLFVNDQPDMTLDEIKLKDADKAKNEIVSFEDGLNDLRDQTIKFVQQSSISIVNRIVISDVDEPGCVSNEECRLNTWILAKDKPLHPVGVRCFLYQISGELDQRIKSLETDNQETLKAIKNYDKIYDLGETEDIVENAEDRLKLVTKQKFYERVRRNEFKLFMDEYVEKSMKQKKRLHEYMNKGLQEKVYRQLKVILDAMIEKWESYFRGLNDVQDELLKKIVHKEKEHEGMADVTRIYVYASAKTKKQCWENLSAHLLGDDLPENIAREIYLGQYRLSAKEYRQERVFKNDVGKSTEKMFMQDVVGYCRQQLLAEESLNMDIINALQKEAADSDENEIAYIKKQIDSLSNLASPMIPKIKNMGIKMDWGIHPQSLARLSQTDQINLFGSGTGERLQCQNSEDFSRYEIIRYKSNYGMMIEDIFKFKEGDDEQNVQTGVYYAAYRDRVRDIERGESSPTPHLDKRWHLPAYMMDINPRTVERDIKKINRAMLVGFICGILKNVDLGGRRVWCFYGTKGAEYVKGLNGKYAKEELCSLHDALFLNPYIVDRIFTRYYTQKDLDIKKFSPKNISEHAFVKGCLESNILDALYFYPDGEPSNTSRSAKVTSGENGLMRLLFTEIEHYYLSVYGGRQEVNALKKVADLVEEMKKKAKAFADSSASGQADYVAWDTYTKEFIDSCRDRQ